MDDTWYYFSKGKQDKKYKGISTNDKGVWFVRNRQVDFGYYLDCGDLGDVLLPIKEAPEGGLNIGDKVDVFLYLDSEERLIATTLRPKVEVNEFAFLEVKWVNQYGAFLDWGL
ncbi:MAG: hypothetical protein II084_04530, partial [Clostridia bacterium]|nr:hypothetical protein [Clostridia bacterium]